MTQDLTLLMKFAVGAPPELWRDVHVGIALSGGADSVALLRASVELKRQAGGKGEVFALHVNHNLRGAESDADAAWCDDLCQGLGVSLEMLLGDVAARAAAEGDGIEAAAREERYRLLTAAAEARGARYLFMGHTRDDQVETVLFRILRGTGIRGLAGIAVSRPLTPSVTLLRPLIECTRDEVIAYLGDCGQDYRFDSSNASCEFARNRIRTELLPLLRENYNAGAHEALMRLAEQAGEIYQVIEIQARELLVATRPHIEDGRISLSVIGFRDQHLPIVREAVRIAWRKANLPEQAMTHDWWCRLSWVAADGTDEVILNLPGAIRAEVDEGILTIERNS